MITAFKRSISGWLEAIILTSIFVLLVALLCVQPVYAAAGNGCDGYKYRLAMFGGFRILPSTLGCSDVGFTGGAVLNGAIPPSSSGGIAFAGCSTDPVGVGTHLTYTAPTYGTFGYDVTAIECTPSIAGSIEDYPVSQVMVLCASFLAFGLGWMAGQQR